MSKNKDHLYDYEVQIWVHDSEEGYNARYKLLEILLADQLESFQELVNDTVDKIITWEKEAGVKWTKTK